MTRSRSLVFPLAALALLTAAPAAGQEQWDRQKGNCEQLFLGYEQATLADLKQCMGLWEAYREVSSLSEPQRQAMAKVFDRLWREGDPGTRHMAKNAMARVGFPPPEEAPGTRKVDDGKPERKRYRPHTAPPDEQKAGERLRERGFAMYKRHEYDAAVATLQQALEHDPASIQALYDTACAYAANGDSPNAIEYLKRLSDIGSKPALAKLLKARTDRDFEAMRDDPEFKRATGYAKVKVMNGMPADDREFGADQVFKLVELLRNPKLAWIVDEAEAPDKHSRDRPHIWYKEPSKSQAYILMRILGHPKTRLVPLDWDSPYDLIASWADKVDINKDGEKYVKFPMTKKGSASLDPEKRMDEALKMQDDALKEPDTYARKAQHLLETPDRVENKIESATDRVQSTVDNVQKVGDKATKLFGK
jgi:tetratricopeptide (TPR) repeat protein